MASFVKWQRRLIEAVKNNDQKVIDYCKNIFPKGVDGKPGSLYKDTISRANQELKLENEKLKNTNKTGKKTTNTKTRSKKKDVNSKPSD